MYRDALLSLPRQFAYVPSIENGEKLARSSKFAVAGMGGSHLAADILKAIDPSLDLAVHSDYCLPPVADIRDRLLILSSHSGNTEEVLDTLETALAAQLTPAIVASGGALLEKAKSHSLPYVEIPAADIEPRLAIGYALRAIIALMGHNALLRETDALKNLLSPSAYEKQGCELRERLQGKIPLILSSERNRAVGYYWKITLNETGKSPAFSNALPEFNHNEMIGTDSRLAAIFLRDTEDNPKIKKRMDISSAMLKYRDVQSHDAALEGKTRAERIFNSLILACWTAYCLAQSKGSDPEAVPMVEEFKKAMKQ